MTAAATAALAVPFAALFMIVSYRDRRLASLLRLLHCARITTACSRRLASNRRMETEGWTDACFPQNVRYLIFDDLKKPEPLFINFGMYCPESPSKIIYNFPSNITFITLTYLLYTSFFQGSGNYARSLITCHSIFRLNP